MIFSIYMWIYEKGIVEKFSIRRRKRREAMDEWLKTRDLPLHFISVAGLVYKGDEVLLIKSKRRGWEIPGGVLEQGEDIMMLRNEERDYQMENTRW